MRHLPGIVTVQVKPRFWPRRVFIAAWLASAIMVLANFHALSGRHDHEMLVIRHLGGVRWQYQGDADGEWFAVRHSDGFFGLISIGADSFTHFFLGFGIAGLLLAALIQWRLPKIFLAAALLAGFMAPQMIVLVGSLVAGRDSSGGLFEMTVDPASRTATGWAGTIPLCQITGGDAVTSARWTDVDLTVNGKTVTLDSFHDPSASYGLLDEVEAAIRAGCPKIETTH